MHSSKDIIYKNNAAFYDIDTDGGQSGSPVFVKNNLKLIGIHKGHQKSMNKNICTLFTK
jgi:V8-like Glu-specific endopeptidase